MKSDFKRASTVAPGASFHILYIALSSYHTCPTKTVTLRAPRKDQTKAALEEQLCLMWYLYKDSLSLISCDTFGTSNWEKLRTPCASSSMGPCTVL